jgi:molecular chaperone GrpE
MSEAEKENPETVTEQSSDASTPSQSGERTVADVEAEMAQMKDQYLRAIAESENGRRRAEREAAESRLYAIDKFARDILGVADNLGRAVGSAEVGDAGLSTLVEGVKMTEASLLEVLQRHGVKRVGAKGDKFDPNVHQAISQVQSDTPAGCIAEVLQPGYVLGERPLRAAMVIVSLGAGQARNEGAGVDVKV